MKFTRKMRSREYGALFVPVECDAEKFVFDLLDCICEIVYDAALFDTFHQVKIMYEGEVVYAWDVPHKKTKQTLFRPYEMLW